jgi:hypothetical protein
MFATSSSSSAFDLRYFSCISCARFTINDARWCNERTYLVLLLPLIAVLLSTRYLAFEMLCLDIYLSESVTDMRHDKDGMDTGHTHLSTASFTFFSVTSSSSSSNWIFRVRPSLVALPESASAKALLNSTPLASDFSSSASRTKSLWLSEVISCSFWRSSCSYFLFFASAASARSIATSASVRRAASFYGQIRVVSGRKEERRIRGNLFDLIH